MKKIVEVVPDAVAVVETELAAAMAQREVLVQELAGAEQARAAVERERDRLVVAVRVDNETGRQGELGAASERLDVALRGERDARTALVGIDARIERLTAARDAAVRARELGALREHLLGQVRLAEELDEAQSVVVGLVRQMDAGWKRAYTLASEADAPLTVFSRSTVLPHWLACTLRTVFPHGVEAPDARYRAEFQRPLAELMRQRFARWLGDTNAITVEVGDGTDSEGTGTQAA